ncbi:Short-chain dehydrogenase/reductase SDR [Penicillium expansum]|nr:Short-chain dehydrogenase/reductase SDR [Penicillium expansum]
MSYNFHDKTVVITGAGSGIGKATSFKLNALGATLILCDLNLESLEQLKTELEATSTSAVHLYKQCDVACSTQCLSVVESVHGHTGVKRLDYLFNCAGINPTEIAITDTTDDYYTRLVDVNLRGTFNMSRACVPLMVDGSVIVNVSSMCGLRGYSGYSVYCATKFAVIGFTKALALELGPKGIRVNAVAPGPIDTPTMVGNVSGKSEHNQELRSSLALERLGEPSEVADVAIFLFSPQSSFMTGSVVDVTGGLR